MSCAWGEGNGVDGGSVEGAFVDSALDLVGRIGLGAHRANLLDAVHGALRGFADASLGAREALFSPCHFDYSSLTRRGRRRGARGSVREPTRRNRFSARPVFRRLDETVLLRDGTHSS